MRRHTISNGGVGGTKKYAIWVDDFGEPEKVGCNFEDTGYMTPEQARVAACDLMEASIVAEYNRCLFPESVEDWRIMAIRYLTAMAREIADGRAELLFYDSMGFVDMKAPGEADVFAAAALATVDGAPPQMTPERIERIKSALRAAMAEVKR